MAMNKRVFYLKNTTKLSASNVAVILVALAPLYAAPSAHAELKTVDVKGVDVKGIDINPLADQKGAYRGGGIVARNAFLEEGDNCISLTLDSKTIGMDAILEAKSDIAGSVMLIDQRMHKEVKKIEIWPDRPLTLKRGAACLILRDMRAQLAAGQQFKLTLAFENAPPIAVDVTVVVPQVPIMGSIPTTPVAAIPVAEAQPAAGQAHRGDSKRRHGNTEAKE